MFSTKAFRFRRKGTAVFGGRGGFNCYSHTYRLVGWGKSVELNMPHFVHAVRTVFAEFLEYREDPNNVRIANLVHNV